MRGTVERYLTKEDVNMRLDNCIVRYKGEPFMSKYAGGLQIKLYYMDESNRDPMLVNSNDIDLDISSFDIGYVNRGERAWFITRVPYRKQKQAVCIHNVVWSTFMNNYQKLDDSLLMTKYTDDAIRMIYPTYKDCLEWVKAKASNVSRAFNTNFALHKSKDGEILLLMNEEKIGIFNPDTQIIDLLSDHVNSIITFKLANLGVPVA